MNKENAQDYCTHGKMDTLLFNSDKEPPVIQYCPDDVVSVIAGYELRTFVSWSEPMFEDNTEIINIHQTYFSGKLLTSLLALSKTVVTSHWCLFMCPSDLSGPEQLYVCPLSKKRGTFHAFR